MPTQRTRDSSHRMAHFRPALDRLVPRFNSKKSSRWRSQRDRTAHSSATCRTVLRDIFDAISSPGAPPPNVARSDEAPDALWRDSAAMVGLQP